MSYFFHLMWKHKIGWENNIGTWTTGNAPFGSNAVHNDQLFNAQTNWDDNSSIYLRKQIDLQFYFKPHFKIFD